MFDAKTFDKTLLPTRKSLMLQVVEMTENPEQNKSLTECETDITRPYLRVHTQNTDR